MPITFATFNVENLFTRPKAMNLSNLELGTEKLKTIALLQEEMSKPTYDKAEIAALAKAAHGYFAVNKTRGATPLSYSAKAKRYTVNVKGRSAWDGFIELKRDRFSSAAVTNTGKFLRTLKADILGICEVESIQAMRQFRSECFGSDGLDYEYLIEGTDPRGIDVGLYSRFPYGTLRTNIHYREKSARNPLFPRDCIEAEIPLKDASLWIVQNHLKSKLGDAATSDARRKAQADRVRWILENRFDLKRDLVIVAGDFNDTPAGAPLKRLLATPDLHDALAVAGVPEAERWTYSYRNEKNQIDHVLVSSTLKPKVLGATVERAGMADIAELTQGKEKPLAGITGAKDSASDHGAIRVVLDLKGA